MKATFDKGQIIIVESSNIICTGLTLLLNNYFPEFEIISFDNFVELKVNPDKQDVFVIVLNSGILESSANPTETLNAYCQAKIIGLITNCYQREQSEIFDDLIYINDGQETVIEIIKTHIQRPVKKQVQEKKLTQREIDVLTLLIKGYSSKQISSELHISIHTVISHRKNITSKLGIKSIAGLTIYGAINNIINIEEYLAQ